jgi:hypothetical protein
MLSVIDSREALMSSAVNSLKLISRHIEDHHMYPMWDVITAVHVMTSGSYRLLPRIIENDVPFRVHVSDEVSARILRRLHDAIHIRLLATHIPHQFTNIRVGMSLLSSYTLI